MENLRHSNGTNYWGKQYAHGWEDNANRLAMRNVSAGTWSGWVEFVTSNNSTSYNSNGSNYTACTLNFINQSGGRNNTDFNSRLETGFYNVDTGAGNMPGGAYGQLIVAKGIDTGMQIYGGYNNDTLYYRGWWSYGSGFSDWKTLLHSGNSSSYNSNCAACACKLTGPAHTNGTDGWFRSDGDTGWYNESHQVGIFSNTNGVVCTYNSATFCASAGNLFTNCCVCASGMVQAGTCLVAGTYIYSPTCICAAGTVCSSNVYSTGCISTPSYFYGCILYGCATSGNAICSCSIICSLGMIASSSCIFANSYVQAPCLVASTCICSNGGLIAAGYICSYTCACILNMVHTNGCVIADGYMYAGGWVCSAAGLCTPGYICSSGTIYSASSIVSYNSSDCNLKKCITPITCALDKIDKIRGVEFEWNDAGKLSMGAGGYFRTHDIGVIAQEVEAVLPDAVRDRDDGYKGVNYEKLIPLLIQAIKEQQSDINELKKLVYK